MAHKDINVCLNFVPVYGCTLTNASNLSSINCIETEYGIIVNSFNLVAKNKRFVFVFVSHFQLFPFPSTSVKEQNSRPLGNNGTFSRTFYRQKTKGFSNNVNWNEMHRI